MSETTPKKNNSLALISITEVTLMAEAVAKSRLFSGITTTEQAVGLMLLCQAEGIHPALALRRYHIIEGKPSMRADAMLGEFQSRGGGVIWHIRSDEAVAATFFADKKKIDTAATERAKSRCQAIIDGDQKTIIENSFAGEETVVRTIADADAKKVSMSYDRDSKAWKKKWNWQQSPRQMLTARVISEAVRVIDPGLIAGIYTEDEVVQGVEAERNDPLPPQKATRRELEILLAERDAIISSGEKPSSELLGQISDAKLDVEEYEEEVRVLNEKIPAEQPPVAPEPAKRGKTAKKPADAPQEAPASAQAAPNEPAWKSHVIAALSLKKFNGRRLDDLSAEEVEFLRVEWLEAYADKIPSNTAKLELANNLKEAIQFWNK